MKYVVRYPDKDTPKERWCFVVLKPRASVFEEGEKLVLMWDGYNWTGIGQFLFTPIPMNKVMYWLEKEEPDSSNKFY